MKIFTLIEINNGMITKGSLSTLNCANLAKDKYQASEVICIATEDSSDLKKLPCAQVLKLENANFNPYLASTWEGGFDSLFLKDSNFVVFAPSTSLAKDLFPRLAVRFSGAQVSDVIEVLPNKSFKRFMYAGNLIAEVEVISDRIFATVRTTAFAPVELTSDVAVVVTPVQLSQKNQEYVGLESVKQDRPNLDSAEVVVSGGRALKSAENFEKVIFPLADTLKAAIGASRAAVDSGYAPNDWQVGQTGKVVAPKLYIAVGISGAVQHLAGMKDSKTIVAINKDPEAAIFEVADYGLVGDLFEIVPKLVEELKK